MPNNLQQFVQSLCDADKQLFANATIPMMKIMESISTPKDLTLTVEEVQQTIRALSIFTQHPDIFKQLQSYGAEEINKLPNSIIVDSDNILNESEFNDNSV